MDWSNIVKLIPLVAGSVNPLAGVIAQQIMQVAESEIHKRQQIEPNKSRETIIQEAAVQWQKNIDAAEALKRKGHENE